jgi:hypothetical protein
MKIKDRLYWFSKNLVTFILLLIVLPFHLAFAIIRGLRIVFITDGSEELTFPWEWDWRFINGQ